MKVFVKTQRGSFEEVEVTGVEVHHHYNANDFSCRASGHLASFRARPGHDPVKGSIENVYLTESDVVRDTPVSLCGTLFRGDSLVDTLKRHTPLEVFESPDKRKMYAYMYKWAGNAAKRMKVDLSEDFQQSATRFLCEPDGEGWRISVVPSYYHKDDGHPCYGGWSGAEEPEFAHAVNSKARSYVDRYGTRLWFNAADCLADNKIVIHRLGD